MKQKSWIETNWWVVLIAALILYVFFSSAPFGFVKNGVGTSVTTTSIKDTLLLQPIVYESKSTPQPSSSVQPIVIPQPYQVPASTGDYRKDLELLIEKYNELAKNYLTVNTFKDTLTLKDSAGNRVGVFNYNDAVSENTIKSRQPSYQLSMKQRTIENNTVTTLPPKLTSKLFVLGEITGSPQIPFNGANAGLMWMNKKDQGYYIKAGGQYINGTIQPQFSIGTAWKIKLGGK